MRKTDPPFRKCKCSALVSSFSPHIGHTHPQTQWVQRFHFCHSWRSWCARRRIHCYDSTAWNWCILLITHFAFRWPRAAIVPRAFTYNHLIITVWKTKRVWAWHRNIKTKLIAVENASSVSADAKLLTTVFGVLLQSPKSNFNPSLGSFSRQIYYVRSSIWFWAIRLRL